MTDLLFVYGTLRKGNANAMAPYLVHHAEFICDGWFQGCMYQISDYPGVIASAEPSHRVYGEVYRLKNAQQVLRVLDDYEECSLLHTQPAEYKRSLEMIQTTKGEVLQQVWIYLYQWSLQDKVLIAGGDFMRHTLMHQTKMA